MSTPQAQQKPVNKEQAFCERLEYFMGQVLDKTQYEKDFRRWLLSRGKTTLPKIYKEVGRKWKDDDDLLESAANFALGFMDATTRNMHHIKNEVYDMGYNEGEVVLTMPRKSTLLDMLKTQIRKITH